MAKLATSAGSTPDITSINLTRLLARLQVTLLQPDAATARRLRASPYERTRVGSNLDHARTLLLRLEQDATSIKVQTTKQELQTELLRKRDIIRQLSERLQELNNPDNGEADDISNDEDLLGEDTPSDDVDEEGEEDQQQPQQQQQHGQHTADPTSNPTLPAATATQPLSSSSSSQLSAREQLFPSSLRSRHPPHPDPANPNAAGAGAARTTSSSASSATTGATTATAAATEHILTHNRTEQEALTAELLGMAQALRGSSAAFAASLGAERALLGAAADGLERNTAGMHAARRRMGFLRRMSEGRGWWGRVLMYAWIAALMLVALLIVGVLPKLRF